MPSTRPRLLLSVPLLATLLSVSTAFTIPSPAADGFDERDIKYAAEGYWEMAKRGIVDVGQVADSYGEWSPLEEAWRWGGEEEG
jgi:hypothetical protein